MSKKSKNKRNIYRTNSVTPVAAKAVEKEESAQMSDGAFDRAALATIIKNLGAEQGQDGRLTEYSLSGKTYQIENNGIAVTNVSSDGEKLVRTSTAVEELVKYTMNKLGCLYVPDPKFGEFRVNFPQNINCENITIIAPESNNNAENDEKAGLQFEVSCIIRCYDNFEDKPVLKFIEDRFLVQFISDKEVSYSYGKIEHEAVNDRSKEYLQREEEEIWKNRITNVLMQKLVGKDADGKSERNNPEELQKIIQMLTEEKNSELYKYIQLRASAVQGDPDEKAARLKRGMQIAVFTNNVYLNRSKKLVGKYLVKDAKTNDVKTTFSLKVDFSRYPNPIWDRVRIKQRSDKNGIEIVEEYDETQFNDDEMFLGKAKFCLAHVNGQEDPVLSVCIESDSDDAEDKEKAEKKIEKLNGCDAVKIKYEKGGQIVDDYGIRNNTEIIIFFNNATKKFETARALKDQCVDTVDIYKNGVIYHGRGLNAQVQDIVYVNNGNFIKQKGFIELTVKVWHEKELVNGFLCQTQKNVWYDNGKELKQGFCFIAETENIIYRKAFYNYESAYGYKKDTVDIMFEKDGCLKSGFALKKQTEKIVYEEYSGAVSEKYSAFNEQTEEIWFYDNTFQTKRALKRQITYGILYETVNDKINTAKGLKSQTHSVKYFDDDSKALVDRKAFCGYGIDAYYIDEDGKKNKGKFLSPQRVRVPIIEEDWFIGNTIEAKVVVKGSDGKFCVKTDRVPDDKEYKEKYYHKCDFCGKEMYFKGEKNSVGQLICPVCCDLVPGASRAYSKTNYWKEKVLIKDGEVYFEENRSSPKHTNVCHHDGCDLAEYEINNTFAVCPNCHTAYCKDHRGELEKIVYNGDTYCNICAEKGKIERGSILYNKIKHNLDFGDRRGDISYFWDKKEDVLRVKCKNHTYSFAVSRGDTPLICRDIVYEY